MSVHVGYTVTDSTVPHGGSGTPTVRLTQSYTPTKPLQISRGVAALPQIPPRSRALVEDLLAERSPEASD